MHYKMIPLSGKDVLDLGRIVVGQHTISFAIAELI